MLNEERYVYCFHPNVFCPRLGITCEVQYSHTLYPPWVGRAWKIIDRDKKQVIKVAIPPGC